MLNNDYIAKQRRGGVWNEGENEGIAWLNISDRVRGIKQREMGFHCLEQTGYAILVNIL